MKARAILLDGTSMEIPVKITEENQKFTAVPDVSDWSKIKYIDFMYDYANMPVGTDGYYVIPRCSEFPDDHLCTFIEREDCEKTGCDFLMTMFGLKTGNKAWCAIVTGYTYEYTLVVGIKDGNYYMYPRFAIDGNEPYEQICVEYRKVCENEADYSGICHVYRSYMLNEGGCKPLKERLNRELKYATESLYIRIRLAWKPAPATIEDQTDENEPPMHVAMTFDDVGDFLDKLKAAGAEKAEICLVGWNVSGHDGRYPQMFPVEPKLGGEAGLKKLIKKAQSLGYQIVCHTNCTDSYSIANNFDMGFVRHNRDGSVSRHPVIWSGGLARQICPCKAMELTRDSLLKLRKLGFDGLHYIDVLSTLPLPECCNPEHPINRRQSKNYFAEVARFAKELFGGFSSEGGYDFLASELDYALYLSFYDSDLENADIPLFDERIPLWQLVYHGIIMSNPYTSTYNLQIKSRRHQLEVIERGGRPTTYINTKFVDSEKSRWEDTPDIRCVNEYQTEHTAQILAEQYTEFKDMMYLQTEFMENHEKIAPDVYVTTYSDGTKVTVDYNSGEYSVVKG